MTAEHVRLDEARGQQVPWKKWGPYLSERQWGTVREDYSEGGNAWDYFSHDQARSVKNAALAASASAVFPSDNQRRRVGRRSGNAGRYAAVLRTIRHDRESRHNARRRKL